MTDDQWRPPIPMMSSYGGAYTRVVNLRRVLSVLLSEARRQARVDLFGSRRYGSGSVRSDIDLLIDWKGSHRRALEAIDIEKLEPYLDVFIRDGDRCESIVNGSRITAPAASDLSTYLNAVCVWDGRWRGAASFEQVEVFIGNRPTLTMAAQVGSPVPRTQKADVVFMTALPVEFTAITARLVDCQISDGIGYGTVVATKGPKEARRRSCVAVLSGPGNVPAALATLEAIDNWRPDAVVLIGIAGGLRNPVKPENVVLGDVVIPQRIVDYEAAKLTTGGQEVDASIIPVTPTLLRSVQTSQAVRTWTQATAPPERQRRTATVLNESLASGEKVVASAKWRGWILGINRKVIAVDTEAAGVARACTWRDPSTPFLVIKSISDYADEFKGDDWHTYAAAAAADLAEQLARDRIF